MMTNVLQWGMIEIVALGLAHVTANSYKVIQVTNSHSH